MDWTIMPRASVVHPRGMSFRWPVVGNGRYERRLPCHCARTAIVCALELPSASAGNCDKTWTSVDFAKKRESFSDTASDGSLLDGSSSSQMKMLTLGDPGSVRRSVVAPVTLATRASTSSARARTSCGVPASMSRMW